MGTRSELFVSDEFLPGAPVPEEAIVPLAVSSAKRSIGVLSMSYLEPEGEASGRTYRMYLRKFLKCAAHEIIKMLGIKGCQSNQCLAYIQPFHLENTAFWLCPQCEHKLLTHKAVCGVEDFSKAPRDQFVDLGIKRYLELADVLGKLSSRLENRRIGHRYFTEFERDVDWLRLMAEQLDQQAKGRHDFVDFKSDSRTRQRSMQQILVNAYENIGKRTIHRILSEPILKKNCLVDMAGAAPYRQDSGNLVAWTQVIINRKHAVGGKYVELGGSHKVTKSVGAFYDQGLNSSKIKRVQEQSDDDNKNKNRGRRSTVSDIQ